MCYVRTIPTVSATGPEQHCRCYLNESSLGGRGSRPVRISAKSEGRERERVSAINRLYDVVWRSMQTVADLEMADRSTILSARSIDGAQGTRRGATGRGTRAVIYYADNIASNGEFLVSRLVAGVADGLADKLYSALVSPHLRATTSLTNMISESQAKRNNNNLRKVQHMILQCVHIRYIQMYIAFDTLYADGKKIHKNFIVY